MCGWYRSLDLKTLASGSYQNCSEDFMFITLFQSHCKSNIVRIC